MSSPEVIYACRWLIRDTIRQSMATYVFWVMLATTVVVIFFCLSVGIEGGAPLRSPEGVEISKPHGHMTLAFGAWRIRLPRDGEDAVHFTLLLLAEWVVGAGGTLLALIWTAGFLPEFLQPANATVLMSKPTARWVLLLGKYLGVLAFAGFQVAVFIIGTYLALGLRTGYWASSYLWGIPILLLQFAAVYSFSVLLAVCTRSTLACVFGSVAFWFLCYGINYGRHSLLVYESAMPPTSKVLRGFLEACYWVLPKPVDMGMLLQRALNATESFSSFADLQKIHELHAFHPDIAMWTSLLFAIVMIVLAAWELADTDY